MHFLDTDDLTPSIVPPEALHELANLADWLLRRNERGAACTMIVPIVGAGASAVAGLPIGSALHHEISKEIFGEVDDFIDTQSNLFKYFNADARRRRLGHDLSKLSLFQFASLILNNDFLKEKVQVVVRRCLQDPTHRPLAYELLAHLQKHGFIDDIICLNFDDLLEESLRDELPTGSLYVVSGSDDVPGSESSITVLSDKSFLIRPFGSLVKDRYDLRLEDVMVYGPESVWGFCKQRLTRQKPVEILLILIGYSAQEPAFQELVRVIRSEEQVYLTLFAIEPNELSDPLKGGHANHQVHQIRLTADVALSLLLEIMHTRQKQRQTAWIPVARHHLISRLLNNEQLADPYVRFKIEIILQAIKSRGSFTLEALGEVDRIRKYGEKAHEAIASLCDEHILQPAATGPRRRALQDYALSLTNSELANEVLRLCGRRTDTIVNNWTVIPPKSARGAWSADACGEPLHVFVSKKFCEIGNGPEVEVVDGNRSYSWTFRRARALNSVGELAEETAAALNFVLDLADGGGTIDLFLIASTGEWLFRDRAWADNIGNRILNLMRKGSAIVNMVILNIDGARGEQGSRAKAILQKLEEADRDDLCLHVTQLNWWRLNRRLTLIRHNHPDGSTVSRGLYFRRRSFTPLISPVLIDDPSDCNVLLDIFKYYEEKRREI
jgi:hypothetical protein